MSLKKQIDEKLNQALKAKDKSTYPTLRLVVSAIKDAEIAARTKGQKEMSDSDIMGILKKMIKQRNDSIAQFTSGGRSDLAEKEQLEVNVLSKYKPAQLDESQISEKVSSAIAESGATSMQDMGKVMGILKNSIPAGTADMGLVSKIVKENLS